MGKTVIAAMVIAEVLRRRGGRILFLAPTKPLVEQHATSMRNVLVVDRITLFTGEATAPEDRELLWRENKINIPTPPVLPKEPPPGRNLPPPVRPVAFVQIHTPRGGYADPHPPAPRKESPRP